MPGLEIEKTSLQREFLDNEQSFRLLVESVKDYAIYMLDPKGQIQTWNPGAERIKGYSSQEIVGKHFSIFYTPDAIERKHPQYELEIAKKQGRYEEEGWRVKKDGSQFWASVVISRILNDKDELIGFAKVTRDLTEKKQAEETAQREEHIRTLAESLPQLCWIARPNGYITWCNQLWYQYTGTTPKEMEGWGWECTHDPKELPRVMREWKESLKKEIPFETEYPLRGVDGRYRWFLAKANPVRDKSGRTLGWIGTNTDIHKQRRNRIGFAFLAEASAALSSSLDYREALKELARHFVQKFADRCSIYVIEEGKNQLIAGAYAATTSERIPPKSQIHISIKRWDTELGSIYLESSEEDRYDEFDMNLVEVIASRAGLAIENARLFKQSQVQIKMLESERKIREQFVATLSHDLRNPLSAAKMSSQLLLRYPNKIESRDKLLDRILHNLERADSMIQDLLDANQIKAGMKVPIVVSEMDLSCITRETLEELTIIHGNRFHLNAPERIQGYWSADATRRILENLCGNAVKYGDPKQSIQVSLRSFDDHVELSVNNKGPVIPPDQYEELFEPFQRAQGAVASGQKGWGLGLTLVKGLAESHSGSIQVRSSAEEGTTFTVCLPTDLKPQS